MVVVDNQSSDGTGELVADEFPEARVVRCANRGFGHANNRGWMTCDARYVLFLNPDTEIVEGTFESLVETMDARPNVGLTGVRQVDGEGRLDTTIRRFPNAVRALGEALSAERLPGRPRWLGERELDTDMYDREVECDWTSGSFMLARREAIESAGFFDERFFMYSDETDLCRRVKTRRLGGAPSAVDDDSPPRGQGGHQAEHRKSLRLYPCRLRAQALLSRPSRSLSPPSFSAMPCGRCTRAAANSAAPQAGKQGSRKTLLGRAPVPHGPPSRFSVHAEQRPDRPLSAGTNGLEADAR